MCVEFEMRCLHIFLKIYRLPEVCRALASQFPPLIHLIIMQNRFTLHNTSGISIGDLRTITEDKICWVDRIANIDCNKTVVELNLENFRSQAIAYFSANGFKATETTAQESDSLLTLCPENEKEHTKKPNYHGVEIVNNVRREGGTGGEQWRGGVILADNVASLLAVVLSKHPTNRKLKVIELGAGCYGLPSFAIQNHFPAGQFHLTCTDSISECVASLNRMKAANAKCEVDVGQLDWGDLPVQQVGQFDVVLFADCVYSDHQAELLINAVTKLGKKGATIIGVFPELRVGVEYFVNYMNAHCAESGSCKIETSVNFTGACNGGQSKGYHMRKWTI